ncbi:3-phosphoshikimate 1-carboxyvinyltransferase [Stieleria varia]|uniref:3-phosphoshikimate 1-carboxyvinyltransferase n=1 Tax=Stieleria varia TaxID=2528005 RepID=A0A5C6A1U8_9BACT|nr:3-phosphoshikimate 1-carboxyvinyltransferase [Stieleria varia]TWT93201.1 3-phosphoshikimate 1-carboxyvinyltransferase [Stieleria varia]
MSDPASVRVIPGGPVNGEIRPPGSKSLTNRALLCAAFADGPSTLTGALRSEDTEVMIEALRQIGIPIEISEGGLTLSLGGRVSQPQDRNSEHHELFIANSGTTVRFLTAALSAAGGNYRLVGVERMHQRPIEDLITALIPIQEGNIAAESPSGCPPVLIQSDGWNCESICVAGSVSSQYLSGLMMAAPIAAIRTRSPREILVRGELVSMPYVKMTAEVMRRFGGAIEIIECDNVPENNVPKSNVPENDATATTVRVQVDANEYQGIQYAIEPDASAASYFWAAAAITQGRITVNGLTPGAMQGDVGFCEVLRQMGCEVETGHDSLTIVGRPLHGIDVDMNAISDTVQTLAMVALCAQGPTRVRGVAHNRFKETDRIGDLAVELRKLGAIVTEHSDGMTIQPPSDGIRPAVLETYNDHRMAMSFSLAGLVADGVEILNPGCTVKTYPEYFADLEKLIGRAHHWRT